MLRRTIQVSHLYLLLIDKFQLLKFTVALITDTFTH